MKTKLLLLFVSFFAFANLKAQVTLPFYDNFDYLVGERLITEGTNEGFGAWTIPAFQSAGGSADPFVVVSPSWSLPSGLPAQSGNAIEFIGGGDDPVIVIPDQGDTGVIYSSFVFRNVDQSDVSINSPEYFYSFGKVASNGTSLNYTSCVYLRKVDENTYNIGISENNNTKKAVWSDTSFAVGQDVFVVINYDIENAVSKLWINPVVTGSEPATTFITDDEDTSPRNNLSMVRLNLGSNAKTPGIILDEVRIGNSWLSVTTNPTAGVSDKEMNANIKMYPNPAHNFVQIDANNMEVFSVELFNIIGGKVSTSFDSANNKVDISQIAQGVYFLKINSGERSITRKIIKE